MIKNTFTFDKPLTSIDISNVRSKKLIQFIDDLKKFFFVTYKSSEIHVSRFRTLCSVAIGELGEGENLVKLSERFADLAGNFYGYSPGEILQYCLDKGFYHLIKY